MLQSAKLLLKKQIISKAQYETAYLEHMAHGNTMGYHLVTQRAINSDTLANFLSAQFDVPRYHLDQLDRLLAVATDYLSGYLCRQHRILPLKLAENRLLVGVTDPGNQTALDDARRYSQCQVETVLVSEEDMTTALERYYPPSNDMIAAPADSTGLFTDALTSWLPSSRSVGDSPDTPSIGVSIEDALSRISWKEIRSPEALPSIRPVDETAPPKSNESQSMPETPLVDTHNPNAILNRWTDTTSASDLSRDFDIDYDTFDHLSSLSSDPTAPPLARIYTRKPSSIPAAISQKHRTEGQLLHGIAASHSSREVISLALEYLLRFSQRAMFFVVNKQTIRGFEAVGDDTRPDSVKTFWIPFSRRSTLGWVALSGQQYLGPFGDTPADAVFCAAFGGKPSHALLVPLVIGDRTVGILFADQTRTHSISWPRLVRLVEAVKNSLLRILKGRNEDGNRQ